MALSLAALCIESTRAGIALDISCQRYFSPAMNRNHIVVQCQTTEPDWLCWIDTDMIFPPHTLIRLLSHKQPIVGCTYGTREEPYAMVGQPSDPTQSPPPELWEFDYLPAGMMLVSAEIYRLPCWQERYKRPDVWYAESVWPVDCSEEPIFCLEVRRAGYKIWCDTVLSREIGHIGKKIVMCSP